MGKKLAFLGFSILTGAIHLILGCRCDTGYRPNHFQLGFGITKDFWIWGVSKDFEVDSRYCPGSGKHYNLPITFA